MKEKNIIKKIIFSPPVGNIINLSGFGDSVAGTYTAKCRKGIVSQYLKTFRLIRENGKIVGYTNQIGFRNPGIENLTKFRADNKILSIAPLSQQEVYPLLKSITSHIEDNGFNFKAIEINAGCPNAKFYSLSDSEISKFQKLKLTIIVKLPPTENYLDLVDRYSAAGIKYFHLFNSLGCKEGGASGSILKRIYPEMIHKAKNKFGDKIIIIAGGGISSYNDIKLYEAAGAEHFSISTAFLNPLNVYNFLNEYYNDRKDENIAV